MPNTRTPLQYLRYISAQHTCLLVCLVVGVFFSAAAEIAIVPFLQYGIDSSLDEATRFLWSAVFGLLLCYVLHELMLKGNSLLLMVLRTRIARSSERLTSSLLAEADAECFNDEGRQAAGDVAAGSADFLHLFFSRFLPGLLQLCLSAGIGVIYVPLFPLVAAAWFAAHIILNLWLARYTRTLIERSSRFQETFQEVSQVAYLMLHTLCVLLLSLLLLIAWQERVLSAGSLIVLVLLSLNYSRTLLRLSAVLPGTTEHYARLNAGLSLLLLASKQKSLEEV